VAEENQENAVDSTTPVVDKAKIAELTAAVDGKFLKDKRYKDMGMALKELEKDMRDFVVNELLPDRSDLVESGDMEAIQSVVERAYSAACRRRLASKASAGKLIVLGVSRPNDYIGNWKHKRIQMFAEAKAQADQGNSALLNKLVNEDKLVTMDGIPIEHRDNKGDDKGKPFKVESSYLANVVGVFTESTDKKRTVAYTVGIGGESNDSIIHLRCEKCGKESPYKKCPTVSDVTDPKTKKVTKVLCGNVKPFFYFDDIVSAGFCEAQTFLKLSDTDDGGLKISWVQQTNVNDNKRQLPKDEVKKLLTTTLKNKVVVGADLTKVWNDHKDEQSYWVIYKGTVLSVARSPDGRGMWKIEMEDSSMALKSSDGKVQTAIQAYIPNYVWEFMDGNQITSFCELAVVGKINRREKYDFQTKRTLVGQLRDPEIEVWGFFVVDGGRPKQIKMDVSEGSFQVDFKTDDLAGPEPSNVSVAAVVINKAPQTQTTQVTSVVEDDEPSEPTNNGTQVDEITRPAPTGQTPAAAKKSEDDWV